MTVRPFRLPPSGPSLVFYVSCHGFGHASRDIEVINAIRARRPAQRIVVRTTVAPWLFDVSVEGPVEYQAVECDTGVAQIDSLRLDEAETLRRASAFYETIDARAAAEAGALRAAHAALVVGDIPPLASAAAAAAGIPSVLLGNFTWDWIYEGYADSMLDPALLGAVRAAYRHATRALRLPMSGGFDPVAHVTEDIPFIARTSRRDPAEVRAQLGLPSGRPVVLASFGGHGLRDFDLRVLERNAGYTIVTTGPAGPGVPPANVVVVDAPALYREGLRYEDLVAAADAVVTKPGYGIISEAIANDTAVLYTSRGHFVEYEVIVAAMHRLTRCRYLPGSDLMGGHWAGHLDRLLAEPRPRQRPDLSGADVAAGRILEML
ncbi:MAG: hypothetical protein KGN76_14115 [Acidobacteriota bacterium]|nr:hypothetical protein [Acidobacteriota bacterium]